MLASDLDYPLDPDLIAQAPLPERDAARLLVMARESLHVEHRQVVELPELLAPSLIVLNDTKVIPARVFAFKPTGGRVELLLVERLSPPGDEERWLALGRASKGVHAGSTLRVPDSVLTIDVIDSRGGGELELLLRASGGVERALATHGRMPLPPYIRRAPTAHDDERYQTVFAANAGAVAAPTAGLHMSQALLSRLRARGHELAFVTLHVGPGTFAPLRSERLDAHTMHAERYAISEATATAIERAKRERRPVLAVGTTVVRTLEASAVAHGVVSPGEARTSIFIYPPYEFRIVDALLTNFHLPRSTLLALVMAFGGVAAVRNAYAQALALRYRFFSYGDAMLLAPKEHAP